MANDLSGRPWRLDTASPGTILWRSWIDINNLIWAGFAATNTLIIKDANGRIVFEAVTPATLTESEIRSNKIGWVQGLILDTLTSGVVMVYIE